MNHRLDTLVLEKSIFGGKIGTSVSVVQQSGLHLEGY